MFTIPLSIQYKKVLSALLRKLFCCPITKLGKITEYPCTHDTSKAQKTVICNDGMEMVFFIV